MNGSNGPLYKGRGRSKQVASKDAVKQMVREGQAIDLREAGASYRAMADAMGMSINGVRSLLLRACGRLVQNSKEKVDEIVAMEIRRLDKMFLAVYPAACGGDLQAIDRALRIMERRARLEGLDKPTKIAPTDAEGADLYRVMASKLSSEQLMAIEAGAAIVDAEQAKLEGEDDEHES